MDSVGAELALRARRRRTVAVLLVAVLGVATGAAPAPARGGSKGQKLPDLVPIKGGLKGRSYAFLGKDKVTTVDRTKNQGKQRVRRTHTDFYLVHDGKRWLLTDRFVPALEPGESHASRASSDHPIAVPLGAYELEVCVDAKNQVRESNEHNNCAMLPRPSHFYVIAETWFGSISGIKTLSGESTETWRSTNASFDFDLVHGDGTFSYLFSGTLKWTDQGKDVGGCAWSGTGTKTYRDDDSLGEVVVNYRDGNYTSNDFTDFGPPFYTITVTCPFGGHSTQDGPSRPATFWNPSPMGTPVPLPFGSRALSGSPSQMANVTWTWDLKAGYRK